MSEPRHNRQVFYMTDTEKQALEDAIEASGISRADYIRRMLLRADTRQQDGDNGDKQDVVRVLEGALEHSHQSIDRLEQLLLQSGALNASLTRALPAPESNGHRPWWRVW